MIETEFYRLTSAVLNALEAALEEADRNFRLDVEHQLNVLTVTVEESGRQFVLNTHAPTQQLWLSSPVSGAGHFAYDAASQLWRDSTGRELMAVLRADIHAASGVLLP